MAADPRRARPLPVRDRPGAQPVGDRSAPVVRDAVFEFLGGESVGAHRRALPQHARRGQRRSGRARAAREAGRLPVVLTGGCFQNARLAESIVRGLQPEFARVICTAACRRATAASRSARRSSPPRKGKERSDVSRRPGRVHRSARQSSPRSTSWACAGRCASSSSTSRSRRATTSSTTSASPSAAFPRRTSQGTLALYEQLLARRRDDDLMAADVRGEIAATGDGVTP